jgi:[ribosomal protein S5]-alanine N-acetyltransferase
MSENLHLRTPRLILRPLSEPDRAEFVAAHRASADFWEPWMAQRPNGQTYDDVFDQMLERTSRELADNTGRPLAAFLDNGALAGILALSNIVRGAFQSAYVGWRINHELTRQGLGTEALTALLHYAFAPEPFGLALHRVQANIIPDNLPSLRLADKLRFRREGYAKDYLKIAGRWQDHIMLAKLADEHTPGHLTIR